MKLYEINEGLRALLEKEVDHLIDFDTGEVFTAATIENLELARDEKIEGICIYYKELIAEADALSHEISILQQRKKAVENRAYSLKEYLRYNLKGESFKTAKVSISYRSTKSVNISVPTANLPAAFIKVTLEPRKKDLAEAINAGEVINGVEIVASKSMSIK